MDRFQKVRKKWLDELAEAKKAKKAQDLETVAKANELVNWVLDLLEDPSAFNTRYEIFLMDTEDHRIQVGSKTISSGTNISNKIFDDKVMRKLADIFNTQKGYIGLYTPASTDVPAHVRIFIGSD